jgi:hypothetical protein
MTTPRNPFEHLAGLYRKRAAPDPATIITSKSTGIAPKTPPADTPECETPVAAPEVVARKIVAAAALAKAGGPPMPKPTGLAAEIITAGAKRRNLGKG